MHLSFQPCRTLQGSTGCLCPEDPSHEGAMFLHSAGRCDVPLSPVNFGHEGVMFLHSAGRGVMFLTRVD